MNELMNITTDNKENLTMSSLEIAKLTEKQHKNVMRDIENMLAELDTTSQLNFELSDYLDSTGRKLPMYNMTKKGILLLMSGYSVNLRMTIIDKVEELQTKFLHNHIKVKINEVADNITQALTEADAYITVLHRQQLLRSVKRPSASASHLRRRYDQDLQQLDEDLHNSSYNHNSSALEECVRQLDSVATLINAVTPALQDASRKTKVIGR